MRNTATLPAQPRTTCSSDPHARVIFACLTKIGRSNEVGADSPLYFKHVDSQSDYNTGPMTFVIGLLNGHLVVIKATLNHESDVIIEAHQTFADWTQIKYWEKLTPTEIHEIGLAVHPLA